MKLVTALILLGTMNLLADDIHLKSKMVYRNVKITQEDSTQIIFEMNGETIVIPIQHILKIDPIPYRPIMASYREIISDEPRPIKTYPHRPFLIVSALAALFAWDSIADASDLPDDHSRKPQKQIFGYVAVGVAIIGIIIALDPVEVNVKSNSISLSLNF